MDLLPENGMFLFFKVCFGDKSYLRLVNSYLILRYELFSLFGFFSFSFGIFVTGILNLFSK